MCGSRSVLLDFLPSLGPIIPGKNTGVGCHFLLQGNLPAQVSCMEPARTKRKTTTMHWPGIEPGSPAWEARILPLNHQCLDLLQGTRSPQEVAQEGRFLFVCLFVFGNRPLRLRGREKLKKKKKKSTRLVRHSLLVILDINFCARRMREYVQRS